MGQGVGRRDPAGHDDRHRRSDRRDGRHFGGVARCGSGASGAGAGSVPRGLRPAAARVLGGEGGRRARLPAGAPRRGGGGATAAGGGGGGPAPAPCAPPPRASRPRGGGGGPPEARPRRVEVTELELERFAPPDLGFRATVSGGTYLRSLARDVGEALGCGAHLATLTRTRVGRFRLADAVPAEQLTAQSLRDPAELVGDLPAWELDDAGRDAVVHGRPVPAGDGTPET